MEFSSYRLGSGLKRALEHLKRTNPSCSVIGLEYSKGDVQIGVTGSIERYETPEEAALREVNEETNIKLSTVVPFYQGWADSSHRCRVVTYLAGPDLEPAEMEFTHPPTKIQVVLFGDYELSPGPFEDNIVKLHQIPLDCALDNL